MDTVQKVLSSPVCCSKPPLRTAFVAAHEELDDEEDDVRDELLDVMEVLKVLERLKEIEEAELDDWDEIDDRLLDDDAVDIAVLVDCEDEIDDCVLHVDKQSEVVIVETTEADNVLRLEEIEALVLVEVDEPVG